MNWNQETLAKLLNENQNWVIETEGDCISISNDEGLDAFIYAGEAQLIVESTLFPKNLVSDPHALNDIILRTHQLMPLTTVCIHSIDGEEYYVAFGSLSVNSKAEVVIEEIETLFDNVGEFLETYGQYLKQEALA
ncbi:DUF2170 family protein [Marinicellulosiphila megalodicopiae]|uniref:DUF2170 family protein n=1 Tax=Marinicellulosiphila megalodicopiae TaxID=2724896 RepID=UPI003BAEC449